MQPTRDLIPAPIERRKRNTIDAILHVLYIVARRRFFLLPAFIVIPLLSLAFVREDRGALRAGLMIPLSIALGILNIIFGAEISTVLIRRS